MKKTFMLSAALLILLAGCSQDEPATNTAKPDNAPESNETKGARFNPDVWVDEETGCHYLIVETGLSNGGVAITPRMTANHSQLCND